MNVFLWHVWDSKEGVWGYSYISPDDIQLETLYSELICKGYKFSSKMINHFHINQGVHGIKIFTLWNAK